MPTESFDWQSRNGDLSALVDFQGSARLHSSRPSITIPPIVRTRMNSLSREKEMDNSELPMALRAAYLAMHRQSDARFARYGVTADQFVLLATLSRGDALTQRELAQRMSSDPSTVRAMLVLLEKQGLVEREVHPSDSRARNVALTAAGKRKFRQLWKAGESIRQKMFDAVEPDNAAELVRLLKQLAETLNGELQCSSN
jgi:DNA-binding MarR family transcriptional regulator